MTYKIPEIGLPVEQVLPSLVDALKNRNSAVLQAPPGAGKTTTVPLWLLGLTDKKIVMLEPRRLAARAAARRMADLLGEAVGETVGYRIRLDTKVSERTRIEVVTEGILTRKLQQDPELSDTGVLIFDEFHERNLQTDLGLALALQCQDVLREDLKLVIMSATLDTDQVAHLLSNAPVIKSEGRSYPVETRFLERALKTRLEPALARKIEEICAVEQGDILVFLPGAGEINRTMALLQDYARKDKVALYPLYGTLSQKDQDKALFPDPDGRRKIVFATDIAETSLTIDGVHIVVDAGLARMPRFHPGSGMTRLETKRISRASADQRRGRAGRQAPGLCYRFWTKAEDRGLSPHSEPEIAVTDLSALALELAKWGETTPENLNWMTVPPPALMAQARDLLGSLDALDDQGRITPMGEKMVNLPLHPRLAHMLIKAQAVGKQAIACDLAAILSERDILKTGRDNPNTDIRARLEILNRSRTGSQNIPNIHAVKRNADDLRRRFKVGKEASSVSDAGLVLAFAYPDRIGSLRKESDAHYHLSGGRGVHLPAGDRLQREPYLVVADLDGKGRDARVYLAAPIRYSEIIAHFSGSIHDTERIYWDPLKDRVLGMRERKLGALVLSSERARSLDPEAVERTFLAVIRERKMRDLPWDAASRSFIERVTFARYHAEDPDFWPDLSEQALLEDLDTWLAPYLAGKSRLADLGQLKLADILKSRLDWSAQQALDEFAPSHIEVPTGSRIRLDYANPETPVLAVRLQEMFGQADVKPVGGGRVPLTIHLLSPARRPAQITQDLAGFWRTSYTAVKKDLKGQYPKHYWPDDPLQAEPTAKAKPRKQ
ncbi:ATP-dependent helicase HrpB [Sneathiella sp.]|jgi:ATP-dependent helicase HrpB|uniref:ATP-dependent helicase HrpB n=1 Tax=Sneathiella sp. TaxID=1964365 RepID=UPI0039E33966